MTLTRPARRLRNARRSFAPFGPAVLGLSVLCLSACGEDVGSVADKIAPPAPAAQDEAATAAATGDLPGPGALFDPATADRVDAFSYSNFDEVAVGHVSLDLDLDFEGRVLLGTATLEIARRDPAATQLILDTDDLAIATVEAASGDAGSGDAGAGEWRPVPFILGADDPKLGARLAIDLPPAATRVRIAYVTSPDAAGLQWLTPAQTAGGKTPFVYSQAQAIHARSMAPLQDTPALRITYDARVRVTGAPAEDVLVLMSARQPTDAARDGDFEFEMPQPIPPYLLAIAAGDIAFETIDETIGVYGEPSIVSEAAAEFEETPSMKAIAEGLYGPYRWGRYDMLVLPPSFPYGGMENPRLTFLTPTLIAGDKSLTNVVAHELAHSWSGNLVTNATWRDAWLNEGFTSYVENRIMEALYGEERATMERALDLASLREEIDGLSNESLSQLKMPKVVGDTDDAFSGVAYLKGMFFLRRLEEAFGRDAFDAFLKSYFEEFAFRSVVTEDFLGYLRAQLMAQQPNAIAEREIAEWIVEPGLPPTIEAPTSDRFAAVTLAETSWLAGDLAAAEIETADWTTHEWLRFINQLPETVTNDQLAELDAAFRLSEAGNAEIAFAWFMQAIPANYAPAFPPLERFLLRVGRGKFIYRLYEALDANDARAEWAREIYARARPGYHPIAQRRIDAILSVGG
ncbi:MAG: aminopeptidase [Alphaproteobacteria bacterium]|nr:aminopeptidase [Alphaproteobacteria bacterium]